MDSKFRLEAKYIAPDNETKMKIYATEGKNGINLGVTHKTPNSGERAVTGLQRTVPIEGRERKIAEEEAKEIFESYCKQAEEEGWRLRAQRNGIAGRRSKFETMPVAPGFKRAEAAEHASLEEAAPAVESEGEESTPTDIRSGRNRVRK